MSTSVPYQSSPAGSFVQTAAAARQALARIPLSLIEVAMRVGVASVFWKSGLTKIASWDLTVQLFADEYRVPLLTPELAAYFGTFNELVASVLVAFGIASRLGAAALLGMTLVIQVFVYPENWSEHLLWASILAYVLARGPGPISVDHLVARKLFASERG
jgi:putative oxidoreductase